jgi:hypothetical protein
MGAEAFLSLRYSLLLPDLFQSVQIFKKYNRSEKILRITKVFYGTILLSQKLNLILFTNFPEGTLWNIAKDYLFIFKIGGIKFRVIQTYTTYNMTENFPTLFF